MALPDDLCFLVPEPLIFPRAPYAEALEVHAKLLARFEGQILADARTLVDDEDRPFYFLYDYVGVVWAGGKGVAAGVWHRSAVIERTRAMHGICRPLYRVPQGHTFRVVVVARALASLHTLEVEDPLGDAPRLRVVSRNDAVEPRQQEHRQVDAHTVTRWVAFDREPRHVWRATPPKATSEDEIADRLIAFYDEPIRREIQSFVSAGHAPEEACVQLIARGARGGDSIEVRPRAHVFAMGYAAIGQALIEEPVRPGFTPVFLNATRWAALRWIPAPTLAAGAEPPPPMLEPIGPPFGGKPLDEALAAEALADEEEDDDDGPPPEPPTPEPAPAPKKPRRPKSEADLLDHILRMGIEDMVDELIKLTPAELDRAIASVGFDPEAERAFGPGLRQRVVEALLLAEDEDP